MRPDYDAVVVGAGVAGLVAGWSLARQGARTLVLEAAAEPGGCCRWHTVGGLRLDRGADSFATARPAVADLAASLGLPVERPAGVPAWVRHEAGQAPLPAGALLGIPARPWAPDVRRVIGWPGMLRAVADRVLPVGADPGGSASLGALVRHRMGNRVLRRLVEPVVGGVYSTDPSRLDVDAVAPGLTAALGRAGSLAGAVAALRGNAPPAGAAVAGITGGMGTLTQGLVAALRSAGGEVRCDTTVTAVSAVTADAVTPGSAVTADAVTPDPAVTAAGAVTPGQHGWTVTVTTAPATSESPGTPSPLTAATVVLAVPATEARTLVSTATNGALELPTAPATDVVVATLVLDAPALDGAPRGTGMLVSPRVSSVAAKAITHATAKWGWLAEAAGPGRHVLRLSYGRGDVPPPEEAFPDLALADASDLLGVRLDHTQLLDHAVVRYPDQLAAHRPGQRAAIDRFREELAARWHGLTVVGSAVAGTGLGAVVANATATTLADDEQTRAGSKHDKH